MIGKAKQMKSWIIRNAVSRKPCRSANTILQSFSQTPFGICSAGVGPTSRHGNWVIIMETDYCQRQFTRIIEGMGLLSHRLKLQCVSD